MREYKEYWKCTWRDKQTISGADFTLDKVYERVNGVLKDDSGFCWKKHPLNINNVNFVQVEQDSQVEVHSGIGDTLYLAVHVGNDRTFIKYGNNNDKIEKVINREVTEHELLAILDKLEGNKQIFDTTYTFDRAIIKLANDEIIEVEVKVWADYDGEQLQIVDKGGTVYLVSSYRCDLIKD